jgi:hypothetical protein
MVCLTVAFSHIRFSKDEHILDLQTTVATVAAWRHELSSDPCELLLVWILPQRTLGREVWFSDRI